MTTTPPSSAHEVARLDAPPVMARFPDLDRMTDDESGICIPLPEADELLLWSRTMKAYPAACQAAMLRQAHRGDDAVEATVETCVAACDVRMRETRLDAWTWWQRVLIITAVGLGAGLAGSVVGYVEGARR